MNKRIVICSDGTWNTPDQKEGGKYRPTNVVKIARAVAPISFDGKPQVLFYDKGVGAEQSGLDRLAGGLYGHGIDENIKDAYRFLIHNYVKDDEIFFFGFSRGAYTVRSVTGLIRNSGLLKKVHTDKIEEAYELYRKDLHPDSKEIKEFRHRYSREIEIKFLGVWDTVGALGVPGGLLRRWRKKRYEFHDVKLSGIVKNGYHAVAIDERRKPFQPTLWKNEKKPSQIIEQVQFPGVHSDVGGGYIKTNLSDISLLWMEEKAEDCGLIFEEEYLKEILDPDALGILHNSRRGIFRILPSYIRQIGEKKLTYEAVHPAAIYRYKNYEPPYKPRNLIEYLQKFDHRVAKVQSWTRS